MNKTTEFSPSVEVCTAAITVHEATGESVSGAIAIGFYTGENEIWIEQEGRRINFPAGSVSGFCKQLKRAEKIAKEAK